MKKEIITISGVPGSGKSSTADLVAKKLGYEHYSSGDLFRKIGAGRGLNIEQANLTAENQKEIDFEVDDFIRNLGEEKNKFVIDSRTAFHWIPDSFKVFLDLDPKIASERIFSQIKNEGRLNQSGSSLEQIYKNTIERLESEKKRYRALYEIEDFTAKNNFDLYLNTSEHDLKTITELVYDSYIIWRKADPS